MRGPIAAIFRYPTVVMFATGRGIANARYVTISIDFMLRIHLYRYLS